MITRVPVRGGGRSAEDEAGPQAKEHSCLYALLDAEMTMKHSNMKQKKKTMKSWGSERLIKWVCLQQVTKRKRAKALTAKAEKEQGSHTDSMEIIK